VLALLLSSAIAAPTIIAHDCDGHGGACCRVYEVQDDLPPTPLTRCDDNDVVDILWVVNAPAMEYMGGGAAVLDEVHLAMGKANEAFANAQIPFSTRLVGLHVTQYEWNSSYIYDLQNPNDGQMDEVHVIRDAKAADLVALITIDGYCGVAFVAPDNPAYGFQGNSADCLLMDWASPMRHELGHNLGSKHYTTDGGGYFSWSAGHVLTLDDGSQVGTCLAGNNLPNYSNPNVLYKGVRTGIPAGEPGEADNHLTFSVTVPMVADFRCSFTACPADTDYNGMIDTDDVLAVLSAWGPAAADPADVVLDGMCNVDDLLVVISAWGACP
jgi:hypothetical protein